MGSITLYLNDFVEDRDRRRRRRLRLRAAALIILLLLGVAAAWPPDRPAAKTVYIKVQVPVQVPVPVEVPVEVPVRVEVPVPARPDPLLSTPARSAISPASLEFPSQAVGSASLPKIVGVTSEGDEPLRIGQVSVDGDGFQVTSDCGMLTKNGRCAAVVVFAPASSGPQTATMTIGTNAGTTTIPLSGVGAATPAVELGHVDFGRQAAGTTSEPRRVRFTNSGPLPVAIGTASLADAEPFALGADECGGTTVPPGSGCEVEVVFHAAGEAQFAGELRIASARHDVVARSELAGQSYLHLPRHLCVTPSEVHFPRTSVVKRQRVTVSNPSSGVVHITGIRTVAMSPARGFTVDATECADRTLLPNERCIIEVAVLGAAYRAGGSMQIVVTDDAGEETGLIASARK